MNSIESYSEKVKPFVVLVAMVLIMCSMTGCKPGDYNINTSLNARNASPEEKGRAEVLSAQADHQRMQTEQERQRAQIETNILAETAKLNQELSAEQRRAEINANIAKSNADVQVSLVNANSWSRFITSVSYGLVIGLVVIACGGGLSISVIAMGRSSIYTANVAVGEHHANESKPLPCRLATDRAARKDTRAVDVRMLRRRLLAADQPTKRGNRSPH